MNVRRAEERDIPRISELLVQVNNVHADGRPDLFIRDCRKYTDDELKKLIRDDRSPIYVCVSEEELVLGYAFCILEETRGSNNQPDMKTLYIDDICVDEAHRREHVGSTVYAHVCKEAKRLGCYHITLNVWELNPTARSFYEAMGLVPLKTTMEKLL